MRDDIIGETWSGTLGRSSNKPTILGDQEVTMLLTAFNCHYSVPPSPRRA